MIRVTIELLPGGDPEATSGIGVMEIARVARRPDGTGDYAVALKKTPPFKGPMAEAWPRRKLSYAGGRLEGIVACEDNGLVTATGHDGNVYGLVYRELLARGIEEWKSKSFE